MDSSSAYTDEGHARQHVEAATKRAKELEVLAEKEGYSNIDLDNDFDKDMSMDYTGTSYWYDEIQLYGDVLEYKLTIQDKYQVHIVRMPLILLKNQKNSQKGKKVVDLFQLLLQIYKQFMMNTAG